MKTLKSWRTTLAGIIVGAYPLIDALAHAWTAGYFDDKSGLQFWLGLGIIIMGVLSKDGKVSGTDDEEKMQALIGGSNTPPIKDEK